MHLSGENLVEYPVSLTNTSHCGINDLQIQFDIDFNM